MSHRGGDRRGGGGYNRREDHRPRETEHDRLRNLVVRIGEAQEFDPMNELSNVAEALRVSLPAYSNAILGGFVIAVTEEPFKIPYLASLFTQLIVEPPPEALSGDAPPHEDRAKEIFDEFCKAFQGSLDRLAWRDLRTSTLFFAHLALCGVVTPESLLALLQSFMHVLDEPGVPYSRAQAAALCAGEGLMRSGPILYEHDAASVDAIISNLEAFSESTAAQIKITRPVVELHSTSIVSAHELISSLISALRTLQSSSFENDPSCLPKTHTFFPPSKVPPYEIPSFLVPLEDLDVDFTSNSTIDSSSARPTKRRELMPVVEVRLFEDDISPAPNTPSGYTVRSILHDTINIFDVNRKEGARIILDLPRWFEWGTFKGKNGAGTDTRPPTDENAENEEDTMKLDDGQTAKETMDWAFETTVMEVILADLSTLPSTPQMLVYYFALITDLCKLSPQTVGPAVGKSFRRMYALLGEGLDVEVQRRFAEWFSSHMSNFGFNWVWKEWIPDISSTPYHPRLSFIRRVLEFEIRLAYYERVHKTLPEQFVEPLAMCIPDSAPGSDFEYEQPEHPYYESAQSLLNLMRGRAPIETVQIEIDRLRNPATTTLTDLLPEHATIEAALRHITLSILLNVGSRSISHFLNAVERWLPLFKQLIVGNGTPEERADYLDAMGHFWRRNKQMMGITCDKLMQYQFVEPSDVVSWMFRKGAVLRYAEFMSGLEQAKARIKEGGDGGNGAEDAPKEIKVEEGNGAEGMVGMWEWDLIKAGLDKAIGRVAVAQKKVAGLKSEEEAAREKVKAKATNGDLMDVDAQANESLEGLSEQLSGALHAHSVLTREQRQAFAKALEGFVTALVGPGNPSTAPSEEVRLKVISEEGWNARSEWKRAEWELWETWGWYRHFCRFYSVQLKSYRVTFEAGPLALSTSGPVTDMVKDVWTTALGR